MDKKKSHIKPFASSFFGRPDFRADETYYVHYQLLHPGAELLTCVELDTPFSSSTW